MNDEKQPAEQSAATWRNRFIIVNLATIAGAALALSGIVLWQTSYVVSGGSVLGFPMALIGLVVSFFAPRLLASRWKRRDRA